jgi:hypothetical protein
MKDPATAIEKILSDADALVGPATPRCHGATDFVSSAGPRCWRGIRSASLRALDGGLGCEPSERGPLQAGIDNRPATAQ